MAAIKSLEDGEGLRCVDIIQRPDGAFGFKEFRRDPEDGGRWTLVRDFTGAAYDTSDEALAAATALIDWLRASPAP